MIFLRDDCFGGVSSKNTLLSLEHSKVLGRNNLTLQFKLKIFGLQFVLLKSHYKVLLGKDHIKVSSVGKDGRKCAIAFDVFLIEECELVFTFFIT